MTGVSGDEWRGVFLVAFSAADVSTQLERSLRLCAFSLYLSTSRCRFAHMWSAREGFDFHTPDHRIFFFQGSIRLIVSSPSGNIFRVGLSRGLSRYLYLPITSYSKVGAGGALGAPSKSR